MHLAQEVADLLLHRRRLEVFVGEYVRIPGKSVEIAQIGGGPRVALCCRGHGEAHPSGLCGGEDVSHVELFPQPAELLGHGLFHGKDHRRSHDTLGMLHHVLRITQRDPE